MSETNANVLRLEHITMQFGGVVAVSDFSMEVNKGEIVALIGPNGAGKTTAFNVITGVYEPTNGIVYFNGEPIVENYPRGKMKKLYLGDQTAVYDKVISKTPDKITKLGIARTFQNIRLFKKMTVFENVLIARHMRSRANFMSATFRLNAHEEQENREKTLELLKLVGLEKLKDDLATSLMTILLVEQNANMALKAADKGYVMEISELAFALEFGKMIASGTPDEIQNNQHVIDAYLGVQEDE